MKRGPRAVTAPCSSLSALDAAHAVFRFSVGRYVRPFVLCAPPQFPRFAGAIILAPPPILVPKFASLFFLCATKTAAQARCRCCNARCLVADGPSPRSVCAPPSHLTLSPWSPASGWSSPAFLPSPSFLLPASLLRLPPSSNARRQQQKAQRNSARALQNQNVFFPPPPPRAFCPLCFAAAACAEPQPGSARPRFCVGAFGPSLRPVSPPFTYLVCSAFWGWCGAEAVVFCAL